MNDQPQISRPDSANFAAARAFAEPGVPHIRTLNVPGSESVRYVCTFHPTMEGEIIVDPPRP